MAGCEQAGYYRAANVAGPSGDKDSFHKGRLRRGVVLMFLVDRSSANHCEQRLNILDLVFRTR
jgi:hypothetical protein